jgi:hypothetical protein
LVEKKAQEKGAYDRGSDVKSLGLATLGGLFPTPDDKKRHQEGKPERVSKDERQKQGG